MVSVVMLSANLLNVLVFSAIIPSNVTLSVILTECFMPRAIIVCVYVLMLSVIMLGAEYCRAKHYYAGCS